MPLSTVDWLLHEATAARPLPVGGRMELDNESWRATIERLEIGAGLRVFLTTAEVHNDLVVQPRDAETDPWVACNVAVSGRVDIELPDGLKTGAGPDQAVMFRPSGRDPRYAVPGRQRLALAGYALNAERLDRVFDGAIPGVLAPLVEPELTASRVVEMRATRRLRTLAGGLFAPGLNGPLRILFIEGTVLQLLASQGALGQPRRSTAATLSPDERRQVHAARDRLLADMRNPPTLGALAAEIGTTEKRLNAGFRREFGATAFAMLRNERLEHARLALEATDLTLKEVAFRVGYNHVNNFINAFTARYGAPPRRYATRRSPPPEDARAD